MRRGEAGGTNVRGEEALSRIERGVLIDMDAIERAHGNNGVVYGVKGLSSVTKREQKGAASTKAFLNSCLIWAQRSGASALHATRGGARRDSAQRPQPASRTIATPRIVPQFTSCTARTHCPRLCRPRALFGVLARVPRS